MTTPWPLRDVLARLADFAHDRLVNHDYDGHGWEELQRAKDEAREMLANWPAPAPKERWIPCSERMPGEFEQVIFLAYSQLCVGPYQSANDAKQPWNDMLSVDMCGDCDRYSFDQVTHWMPLPTPPVTNTEPGTPAASKGET